MQIRAAVTADAPVLGAVMIRSWQAAYRGVVADSFLDFLDIQHATKRFERLLSAGEMVIDIAESDGRVLGYVSYGAERQLKHPNYSGEVSAIYILPEYWRMGLGKKLMSRAIEGLRERGHKGMLIWVLRGNTRARRFYESMGGKPLGGSVTVLQLGENEYDEMAYCWADLARFT